MGDHRPYANFVRDPVGQQRTKRSAYHLTKKKSKSVITGLPLSRALFGCILIKTPPRALAFVVDICFATNTYNPSVKYAPTRTIMIRSSRLPPNNYNDGSLFRFKRS